MAKAVKITVQNMRGEKLMPWGPVFAKNMEIDC